MSARVLRFTRQDGVPAELVVSSPDADRLFALLGKLQQLQATMPTAARVLEQTIDQLLGDARQ